MKILLFNLITIFFLINGIDKNPNMEIKILNSNLKNGDTILIEFKNNTKYNYCFLIDANYYNRDVYFNRNKFQNPKVVLYDDSNRSFGVIWEIKDSGFHNDTIYFNKNNFLSKRSDTLIVNEFNLYSKLYKKGRFNNTLTFYKVRAGKSFKLKIPFHLVVEYLKDNVHSYYEIDKSKKYKGRIEYFIKQNYINKYVSKHKIDSIENQGYKIFTGSLKSNKVPLLLN
ncbi:hypothetical protein [Flavobacterium sp.]|uniref:hypothetical protein n=1 Tax=Flavobacterium sp. TaxID=239 RepID=UPI0025FDF589|nr:hypothetical protein [Flavobacterium sp.]